MHWKFNLHNILIQLDKCPCWFHKSSQSDGFGNHIRTNFGRLRLFTWFEKIPIGHKQKYSYVDCIRPSISSRPNGPHWRNWKNRWSHLFFPFIIFWRILEEFVVVYCHLFFGFLVFYKYLWRYWRYLIFWLK